MAAFLNSDKCRRCGKPLEWDAVDVALSVPTFFMHTAWKGMEVRDRYEEDYTLCRDCGKLLEERRGQR